MFYLLKERWARIRRVSSVCPSSFATDSAVPEDQYFLSLPTVRMEGPLNSGEAIE